jgi:hypothetical protein
MVFLMAARFGCWVIPDLVTSPRPWKRTESAPGSVLGLKGTDIPVEGRIAAIADVFDALTTHRVYRRAYPIGVAVEMMKEESGTHFDPELLDLFWCVLPEVLSVKELHERVGALAPAI